MCGRFVVPSTTDELLSLFDATGANAADWKPSHSVAATDTAPIVREWLHNVLLEVERQGLPVEGAKLRIAIESARYLSRITRPGDTIGVSWGRTIYALTEYLRDLPTCTVVQLTGTIGNDVAQSPMEVLHRIAARHPLSTVGVFAPLFAATPTAAQVLRSEKSIADALGTYDRLTTAVLAIGAWNPPITQIRSLLDPDELAGLDSEHAVAEVVASFLDADGRIIDLPLNQRRIAIKVEQLRSTPPGHRCCRVTRESARHPRCRRVGDTHDARHRRSGCARAPRASADHRTHPARETLSPRALRVEKRHESARSTPPGHAD